MHDLCVYLHARSVCVPACTVYVYLHAQSVCVPACTFCVCTQKLRSMHDLFVQITALYVKMHLFHA